MDKVHGNNVLVEPTTDWELITRIVTDKSVYHKVSDDFSPLAANWKPAQNHGCVYLLVKCGEDVLGLFFLAPVNGVSYQVHTCLLPNSYGEKAMAAAQKLIEWVFLNLNCKRLITEVPDFNKLAKKFAEKAGMQQYGYNPDSYQRDGRLQGVTLLGISKGVH